MDTIYSLLKRAKELKEKSQVDSITPEEVGKLHEDTLAYIASLEQSTDGLGIKKVYQSKSAMEADTDPVGTNGKSLRYGQLVSIYDDAHADSSENGNIYAYQKPGWLLIGKVSDGAGLSIAQEAGDSTTKVMSQAAVTQNIKKALSEALERKVLTKVGEISSITSFNPIYDNKGVASTYQQWDSQSFEIPSGIKRIYGKGSGYLFTTERYLSPIVFLDERHNYISSMILPTATLTTGRGIIVPFDISNIPEKARFVELSKNQKVEISTYSISFEYEKEGLEDRLLKMEQVGSGFASGENTKEVSVVNKIVDIATDKVAREKQIAGGGLLQDLKESVYESETISNIQDVPYSVGFINKSGEHKLHSNWRISQFFSTKEWTIVSAKLFPNSIINQIAFYDDTYTFISGISKTENPSYFTHSDIVIPINAKYFRFCWTKDNGGFEENRILLQRNVGIRKIVEENKENIKTIKQTLGLKDGVVDINWCGLFSNVLFIGDSVTGGDTREPLVESGTHNMDYRPYSYPMRIKQLSPTWDITNAGYSGISSSGWYGRLESKTAQIKNADLIIIELGWNDWLTGDLNTDVVPFGDNYDRYATTAIGYYCKIVAKSKAYNPNAFIILVASAGWKSQREGLQDKVKNVSQLFGVPFIDMNENKYLDITPDGGDTCHFTVQGYYKKAVYMYHAISDCIRANMNEVRKKLYARLQSNRSYTVTGTVTTDGTTPLVNATITITSQNSRKEYSAQTQSNGAFSIKLPNGTYAIGITGYTLSKTSLNLSDGGDKDYSRESVSLGTITAIRK